MPLHIGEKLFLDGEIGRVVATTDTTDANGRGSVSYGGHAFSFRALKATVDAVDYPLVATADAEFRVGVVQQDANPALFCMVLDDGPAPWGWGRRVKGVGAGAPTYWAAAEAYADEDAVVFRMGWAPGEITILKGGVEEAGVYADLVLTYATSDGEHVAWWQPAYPSKAGTTWGAAEGRFQTDANGVLWDVSEGSSQPIIVPRGFGALGYRSEEDDGWLSCPTAERTLSKLEVWYQQEHAEVSEGIGTTLNVAGVSITITGPSNATVELQWENGIVRGNPQLTGGTATLTGLPPGKYCVRLYSDDLAEGIAPQEVQCESGGDYTVAFGSWITVDPLKIQGVVYAYGATPAAGATLWACYETGPGGDRAWTSFATCDANGAYGPVAFASGLLDIFAYHATWGAGAVYGFQDGAADGFWWDPTLGATFGGIVSANTPDFQESIEPWGAAGPHENLMLFSNVAYAIDPDRQTVFRFGIASGGHGIASEPCPRGWWSPDSSTEANEWTAVIYDIYDADDTLMASAGLADSATPPWSKSPIPYAPRDQ
ncbi:MAG: hypothetical protein FJX74_08285, partial [Armatimonadetes bacterium]|nr:hypothetical protein [Armatimonadota bacterium]